MASDSNATLMSPANLSALLKKTSHYDKDERYMATSDLCEVLKRHQQHQQQIQSATSNAIHNNAAAAGGGAVVNPPQQQQQQQQPFAYMEGLDAATERQICTAVLRLLHDKSNDVQAIAVKTLSVLLTTVQQEQVREIADSLADQVLDANKSELRDVYAIGLRTLIKNIPVAYGNSVAERLVGRLLDGCSLAIEDITLACLDALTDLLERFGMASSVVKQHDAILQVCLSLLSTSPQQGVVRKRAGTTLSRLSVVLSDTLLHRMVEHILASMENSASAATTTSTAADDRIPALIRAMCGVSKMVGHRLGQAQIDRIVPIFLRYTPVADATEGGDAAMTVASSPNTVAANELRESCLVGFESFALKCPRQIEPHLDSMIRASLTYMSYDPNYSYDDDDEDDEEEPEDAEAMSQDNGGNDDDDDDDDMQEDDEDDEDDEYGQEEEEDDGDEDDDDDDESWKVRRSAIRAIRGVVESHRHDPALLWTHMYLVRGEENDSDDGTSNNSKKTTVAAALVRRFKEREENCRVGVLECFNRLLAVTVQAPTGGVGGGGGGAPSAAPDGDDVVMSADSNDPETAEGGGGGDSNITTTTTNSDSAAAATVVRSFTPKVVKACLKILALKGAERSKSCAMALLSTLCTAPGGLGGSSRLASVFNQVRGFLQVDGAASPTSAASGRGAPPPAAAAASSHHFGGGSKALRLDALSLVRAILVSDKHDPEHIRTSLPVLIPSLGGAVQEQWYKVIAEALRAIAAIPKFYADNGSVADVATQLYGAVAPLLAANDVDQEIKECALKACASILSDLHASLATDQSTHLLRLLLERLQNETTRVAAMKTLSQVAASQKVDVSPILSDAMSALADVLKLASRTLKQTSLETLDVLVVNHGSYGGLQGGELYSGVVKDLAALIVDSDLHLSHLSLYVPTTLC
jgi:cullin-associated NEDD8-dissociated protein 1